MSSGSPPKVWFSEAPTTSSPRGASATSCSLSGARPFSTRSELRRSSPISFSRHVAGDDQILRFPEQVFLAQRGQARAELLLVPQAVHAQQGSGFQGFQPHLSGRGGVPDRWRELPDLGCWEKRLPKRASGNLRDICKWFFVFALMRWGIGQSAKHGDDSLRFEHRRCSYESPSSTGYRAHQSNHSCSSLTAGARLPRWRVSRISEALPISPYLPDAL
jgi:hypothetical protein